MSQHAPLVRLPLPTNGPLEPPADWKRLREQCPVATVELPSGDTGTLLTRYDHVKTLLSDPRFSRPTAEDAGARIAPEGAGGVSTNSDMSLPVPLKGDGHLRWRRLVTKYFTAKRMTALRPRMVDMTEALVDDMVRSGWPADLKAALGFPLPVYVICDLLGAPAEDRDRFSYWSDAFLNVDRYTKEETKAAYTEFVTYMSDLVVAKRAQPGDDVISMLIEESRAEDQGLSDPELVGTGMGLLVAGHETTANMIGKMIAVLLADRTRWEGLLANPSLVRTAVDEVLRSDANLGGFGARRYLTEDFEVGGAVLPGGTTVFCALSAANRDEHVFPDPDEMDLTRSPNPHLTFGAGAHSCLGQSLARTELQVALEVLLHKLPSLELAVPVAELQQIEGLTVGGLREVPVRW
ncbi:cytochrome P450 [Streptomyces sp. NPDC090798]|uniref:cytochrome P450 n=1 Tax=Streptomyces sp. NPDC090798 TaxID=3365968 RepID=UPI00382ED2F0